MFSEFLRISFSLGSSLDIHLFTYAFSCSFARSSRRILPTLASSLTFLSVFLDSLYAFYFLLSLIVVSFFPAYFTQNPFSTNLNYNNFLQLTKLQALSVLLLGELIKNTESYCSNYNLTNSISRSKRGWQIICSRGSHLPAHVKPSCNA